MLKYLRIKNIILIDDQEILFEKGLNVITGETGSGKSALIEALGLIMGDRADSAILRKGCDKGSVEASFEIDGIRGIPSLLEQAGIEHHPEDILIIRRELSTSGKSRCWINNQMAQLTILRELGCLLIERTGQHANQRLCSLDYHRSILDLFSSSNLLVAQVKEEWHVGASIRKQLSSLIDGESQRLRDIEICRMELEELQEAHFKEGEEEALFSEYCLLSNAEDRGTKVSSVLASLSSDKISILALLNRHQGTLESLAKLDSALEESMKAYNNAVVELQEVAYTLRNYQTHIEHNPERMIAVNARLTLLNRLKRKYGSTIQEIMDYRTKTEMRLNLLENADMQIEELREQLQASEERYRNLCSQLTALRKEHVESFTAEITKHLRSLNMPKVEFHVHIEKKVFSENGEDKIEFFLQPNIGEKLVPIRECASGGELSRLMLAMQTILAGKEQVPTIVFDEIDSNIGGQTAVGVADMLYKMGKNHQILCITHFSQVASQADYHLQISKHEEAGRTVTRVRPLDSVSRESELARMQGSSDLFRN